MESLQGFLSDQLSLGEDQSDPLSDSGAIAIVSRILSKKWRCSAIDEESLKDLNLKVRKGIENGLLHFSLPFGGYKSYKCRSFPHVDWAEVFAVSYLRKYLTSVVRGTGIKAAVTFSYCSGVMDLVNRLSDDEQDVYIEEFKKILQIFSEGSVDFKIHDVADSYGGREATRQVLLQNFAVVSSQWDSLESSVLEKRLGSAARNLRPSTFNAGYNLSISKAEIIRSAMMCEALDSLPERRNFNKYSEKIQLVNVRGPSLSVHIRSCEGSANHFGVSSGVCIFVNGSWARRIMSTAQMDSSGAKFVELGGWAPTPFLECLDSVFVLLGDH